MDSTSLAVFYYAIRLAHSETLSSGDILLGFWRDNNKIAVSVLSRCGKDDVTIDHCNTVVGYATRHNFIDNVHVEPASWKQGDGDTLQWMLNNSSDNGVCLFWENSSIYVATGPRDISCVLNI